MAEVPRQLFRQVEPIARVPYANVGPEHFGAGIGQAVQGVGDELNKLDAKYQDAEARDADTEFQKRLSKLWFDPDTNDGYSTKRLKDALDDGYKNVETLATQALEDVAKNIKGPEGQAAFRRAATARLFNFTERMSAHAGQQRELWELGSSQSRVKESIAYASNFYNDDKLWNSTFGMIEKEALYQSSKMGEEAGSAMAVERRRALEGSAWAARLNRAKSDNPQFAYDMLQKNFHRMDTITALQLEQQLRAAVEPVWAKSAADAIVRGAAMPNKEVGTAFTDAIMWAESRGRRFDDKGKLLEGPMTKKGTAKGEMQVLDSTNKDPGFGVVPAKDDSPEERARVGRDYGNAMLRRYGSQTLALAAYNWGPDNVDKLLARGFDPRAGGEAEQLFMAKLPDETRKYIEGINKRFPVAEGKPPTNADIEKNLGAWIERAKAYGNTVAPNDPVFRDMVVSQVQQHVNTIAAANNATERMNRDTLVNHIIGNQGGGMLLPPEKRPHSLEELLKLPGSQDAWIASDADQKRAILTMLEQEAKGFDPPETQEALDVYYNLLHVSRADPGRFIDMKRTPLNDPKLVKIMPKARLNHLIQVQNALDTKEQKELARGVRQNEALNILKPMMQAAGLEFSKDEGSEKAKRYGAFVGRLNEAIDNFAEKQQKVPTPKDIREIGTALLAAGRQQSAWGYVWSNPPKMFESEAPEDWITDKEVPQWFVDRVNTKRKGIAPERMRELYSQYILEVGTGNIDDGGQIR